MRAIHNEEEYTAALADMERLWDDANSEAQDDLEVLAILIADYESTHFALEAPDPIEALKNTMEWRGLTPRDLEQYIGGKGHVSEVLNGRRQLSKEMIRSLAGGLRIPTDILLGPPQKVHRVEVAVLPEVANREVFMGQVRAYASPEAMQNVKAIREKQTSKRAAQGKSKTIKPTAKMKAAPANWKKNKPASPRGQTKKV